VGVGVGVGVVGMLICLSGEVAFVIRNVVAA
jgi:hypothetical protein